MRIALILVLLAFGAFSGPAWAVGLSSDKEAQIRREHAQRRLSTSLAETRIMLDTVANQATENGTKILDEAGDGLERVPVHIGITLPRLVKK